MLAEDGFDIFGGSLVCAVPACKHKTDAKIVILRHTQMHTVHYLHKGSHSHTCTRTKGSYNSRQTNKAMRLRTQANKSTSEPNTRTSRRHTQGSPECLQPLQRITTVIKELLDVGYMFQSLASANHRCE